MTVTMGAALTPRGGWITAHPEGVPIEARHLEGGYWITARGDAFSTHTVPATRLRPSRWGNYLHYRLYGGLGERIEAVHRLVLKAFRGPPPRPDSFGRHLNGDPLDNRLSNLAWGTAQDNAKDAVRHGSIGRGERNSNARLSNFQVLEIRTRYDRGDSPSDIGYSFGIGSAHVVAIGKRKVWSKIAEPDSRKMGDVRAAKPRSIREWGDILAGRGRLAGGER